MTNETGNAVSELTITLNGVPWDTGYLASGTGAEMGVSGIDFIPGKVPDDAEISWVDHTGAKHGQHVKITPLPPPTPTSFIGKNRRIFFILQKDNTVLVMYHDPRFTG